MTKSYERSYDRRQDDELRRIAGVYTFFYDGLDDKQVREILAGHFEDKTGSYNGGQRLDLETLCRGARQHAPFRENGKPLCDGDVVYAVEIWGSCRARGSTW